MSPEELPLIIILHGKIELMSEDENGIVHKSLRITYF